MRGRAAAIASASLLLLFLVLRNDPSELRRRARFLIRSASNDLPVRRLEGSSAAMDRRFFFHLESVRKRLPPGTIGVAFLGHEPAEQIRHLAHYHFAPIPVLFSPREVPRGWVAAIYGPGRPEGWRRIAEVSDGALMAPPP